MNFITLKFFKLVKKLHEITGLTREKIHADKMHAVKPKINKQSLRSAQLA